MKNILLVSFLLFSTTFLAQTPQEFTYQAIVRDASGNLLTNQSVGVQLSILKTSASGSAVFVETHSVTTNINGLITLNIGTGNSISGSMVGINWSSDSYYIKSEIDITGGTNYTISGTSKLVSVPYALHAKTSGTIYKIGDFAYGGIVFWVDESGKHGLVVSKFDVTSSASWMNSNGFGNTHAKGDGLFAGKSNTSIIIASQNGISSSTNNYAARLVNEFQATEAGVTYGDWYLPSIYELNLLYLNKKTVNNSINANSGESLANTTYWSSNEVSNTSSSVVDLTNGNVATAIKNASNYVRAIRSF
uniref:Lcl domain-containing protein n=1 Tax=uncultured Polaribacter sp. TaxID=174711 RepID=UPI00261EB039|nr:DUF1566 domain-containing protein [uncultured Polaribacter sp.]